MRHGVRTLKTDERQDRSDGRHRANAGRCLCFRVKLIWVPVPIRTVYDAIQYFKLLIACIA